MVKWIRKRAGEVVKFHPEKITNAIAKAMHAVSQYNKKIARQLTKDIIKTIDSRLNSFKQKIPDVEQVQDIVEEILMASRYDRVAKAYILYRRSRTHARELKKFFSIRDDLKLGVNAIKVLEERYLLKDEKGNIKETPAEMFRRVARAIAENKAQEEAYFNAMRNLEFLPNSPTLMNAGTKIGQLSACFVLDIEDSLEGIFTILKNTALIMQSGGGVGFSFSKIRPKGDIVKSTKGVASGPVSFMRIYDTTIDVIKAGGKRRGAAMGILDANHPDIEEFVVSKKGTRRLSNFNISVAVTDKFMRAVLNNEDILLINPRNKKIIKKINSKLLFDSICRAAWQSGDPGMIFIDEHNRHNPTPQIGKIESTNPCGEAGLLPYESCNLGSINLAKMIEKSERENKIDWSKLKTTVHLAVQFLDDVIDKNRYPLPEIERITKANRKIGLGVMGFADLLIKLRIPYNSNQATMLAEKLMAFISEEARAASIELAKKLGSFPNFKKSIWKGKVPCLRNATLTTVAPTGTISIIAGCSSGIEPLFALSFVRNVMEGKKLIEINNDFKIELIKRGLFTDDLIKKIALSGSIQKTSLPRNMKKIYVTALEIPAEWHINLQAAFQKHTDNAVSKTINVPEKATVKQIKKAFMLAWKLKCKGITVYRYGSKPEQVLYIGKGKKLTTAELSYSGGCASGICQI